MLPSEKKRYNQLRLRRNANPMLNVEQFERYNYLKERVNLFTHGEYSEYIKLHTQFQDSIKDIYAQPTVSTEQNNQQDVENDNVEKNNNNVENNVEAEIIVEKNLLLEK